MAVIGDPVGRAMLLVVALASTSAGCHVRSYLDPAGPRYAGTIAEPARDQERALRVVSFNIAFGEHIERAIEALRSDEELRSADVVLLQEMNVRGAAAIARALRLHHVYYPASERSAGGFGNAVLSRWPIVEDHKVLLPHPSPLNGQRRIAVAATIDAPGGRIAVYAVHAETVLLSLRGRLAQLAHVLDDVEAHYGAAGLPVIIGGDFNTLEPWSVPRVRTGFFLRGFEHASREVTATADYPFGAPVLDHVFVRGLEVLRAGASRTDASDHRALYVVLGVRRD